MDWLIWFNIILGVVCGFVYLYEEVILLIIYWDIKVVNIFFDKSFDLKIGDFGLVFFFLVFDDDCIYFSVNIVGIKWVI